MIHLVLHGLVPGGVAFAAYRERWLRTWVVLVSTMFVDVDHLLAEPVYDAARCSMGFHPLHTAPALVVYGVMLVAPFMLMRLECDEPRTSRLRAVHLVGLGLVIHMALDALDCIV